mmetsp:Transcript_5022/g.12721  ORF Transcript_5022/g.12721 Transcript_5022/m.12721 type:complete len:619 (+) Transcript_5022:63-1919(+)
MDEENQNHPTPVADGGGEVNGKDEAASASSASERQYYQSIIDALQQQDDNDDCDKTLDEIIQEVSSKSTIKFHHQHLTDMLVQDLLFGTTAAAAAEDDASISSRSSSSLATTQKLVASPGKEEVYLTAVSLSLRRVVEEKSKQQQQQQPQEQQQRPKVSSNLLQVWMYQMVHSKVGKARQYFTEALMMLISSLCVDDDDESSTTLLDDACGLLYEIWKQANSSSSSSSKDGSVVSVRCVSIFVQMLVTTDDEGADNRLLSTSSHVIELAKLLVSMISNFDDPLLQMSVLDEINHHASGGSGSGAISTSSSSSPSSSPQLQKFWSSPDLMEPILKMIHDPILASTALQYLTQLCVHTEDEQQQQGRGPSPLSTVLEYIRDVGNPPPTAESERLSLIHAVSNLISKRQSPKFTRAVLDDRIVRCSWWGDVTRISTSKLQAAVLMSVRCTMVDLLSKDNYNRCDMETSDDSNSNNRSESSLYLAVDLYSKFGPDNDPSMTTTQWLLQGRFVSNTLAPEVRIATYSLLAAMVRIPIPSDATANAILGRDTIGRTKLLEMLSSDTRESSTDTRNAYFDLLESYVNNRLLMGDIGNDGIRKKLQDKYDMGPHGQKPQRWDVATE